MIGSFICMLGINFPMLLLGRSIQALGCWYTDATHRHSFSLCFHLKKRGMAMGMFGLVIGLHRDWTNCSWLVRQYFDWRYLFLVVLLIGMIDFVPGYLSLPNITELSKPNFRQTIRYFYRRLALVASYYMVLVQQETRLVIQWFI